MDFVLPQGERDSCNVIFCSITGLIPLLAIALLTPCHTDHTGLLESQMYNVSLGCIIVVDLPGSFSAFDIPEGGCSVKQNTFFIFGRNTSQEILRYPQPFYCSPLSKLPLVISTLSVLSGLLKSYPNSKAVLGS